MGISEELQPQVLAHGTSFERALVPLDGSASAERSLTFVRALSEKHGLQVVLARVIDPDSLEIGPAAVEEAQEIARLYLRQVASALGYHGIEARMVVRAGPVAPTILAVAAEEGSSIIAMSTHGRLTPEEMPLGTVARELVRSSSIPILAVPSHAHAAKPSQSMRTMLLPVDGNGRAEAAALGAVDFAVNFGVDIVILLKIFAPEPTGRGEAEERVDAEARIARLAHLFERNRIPTVPVIQETGDPVRRILEVAHDHKADVVALSAHQRVTDGVIKELDVPVLLTRSLLE